LKGNSKSLGFQFSKLETSAFTATHGRTIWIADAHRGDGKRYVVHADEKLTAFMELEAAICACSELS
jgi:hypothetical protein